MKSITIVFAFCLLLVNSFCSASESIFLVPSCEAPEKETVSSILRRCEAYGYTGMKAESLSMQGKPAIRLSSPSAIGDQMKETLARLLSVSGKSVDLCQLYAPTEAEKEQFKAGGTAAPKGTEWAYRWGYTGNRIATNEDGLFAPPILIFSERSVPKSEMAFSLDKKSITIKMDSIQKRKMFGSVMLRIDNKLLCYVYRGDYSICNLTVERPEISKKCKRCNGEGRLVASREVVLVGVVARGQNGYREEMFVVCPVCAGSRSITEKKPEVVNIQFEDKVAFIWITCPMPFSCEIR